MICRMTESYQEVWLKNGSLRPAAGDKSNYNQSNLAAAIIFTCYISLIKDFTVAIHQEMGEPVAEFS